MKFKLLTVALLSITGFAFAQQKDALWKTVTTNSKTALESRMQLPEKHLYELNVEALKSALSTSPQRNARNEVSTITFSLPNADGKLERVSIYENAIMEPELAAKFPEIKSYVGIGIDNPTATAYFSVSPLGFKSMTLSADKSAVFIEPLSTDLTIYSVYKKSDKKIAFTPFECGVIESVAPPTNGMLLRPNADDTTLRTYRLAMSVTGEYTAYFGGTKALALAAINNTMTRVNGVFEKDFGVRMVLIANNDLVIYTAAASDPYSPASSLSNWNSQLQSTLTSVIGEANYDVGHLFGASGGGGNAGCIGCVCVNGSKGSGYTSPSNGVPSGDTFDIDYVAHELGHQFGANHTFTQGIDLATTTNSNSDEGTSVQMEPGSGSTIMGYAGITIKDVQPNSDAYFHAISIQQVTNYIKTTTCQTNTATGNSVPVVNAGLDFTIPKSTPFMLTGSATDANGDALTYNWEQMNSQTTNAVPTATKTSGVNFRSYPSSTSSTRYFPRMQSVLTGATTTAGSEVTVEALPSVARTLNFRMTVRDNRAGGPANNSDDTVITVNATAGPFSVSSPNTAVSYVGGSSQTITWAVAGTTANGVNCANVDILISTDGGNNWSTLLAATPNDGTQAVTIPNTAGTTNRIMVKGTNHIFFDVSNTNFTITAGVTDTTAPTAPTLSASGTTSTSTNLSWSGATDNVAVTGYDVFRGTTLIGSTTTATTFAATGLTAATAYSFSVKAKDAAGNVSINSNSVNVTTLANAVTYCASQGNSVADEKIGRVQFGTINNTSTAGTGYENYTAISSNVVRGTAYTITITPSWTSTVYSEGYAVFIDYNQDGDFIDAGETAYTKATSTVTPATGTITIPTTASIGSTRMRVSMKYNGTPTSCEAFSFGQVEDYTLNILASREAQNVNELSFNLYPNPVTGNVLNITNLEKESNYIIYNMMGQELGKGKVENESIYVGSLSTGTYLIEVSNENGATSKRFIKQ